MEGTSTQHPSSFILSHVLGCFPRLISWRLGISVQNICIWTFIKLPSFSVLLFFLNFVLGSEKRKSYHKHNNCHPSVWACSDSAWHINREVCGILKAVAKKKERESMWEKLPQRQAQEAPLHTWCPPQHKPHKQDSSANYKPPTACSKRHFKEKKNRNLSQIVANCQQIAVFFSPFLMVP